MNESPVLLSVSRREHSGRAMSCSWAQVERREVKGACGRVSGRRAQGGRDGGEDEEDDYVKEESAEAKREAMRCGAMRCDASVAREEKNSMERFNDKM